MTRHRLLSFGRPVAPWRATYVLAELDAIDIGEASRDPDRGTVYLSPGATIEHDDGVAPMTHDQERWAEALAVLRISGARAEEHVAERMRALAEDPDGRARWKMIGDRIKQVREAARRAAQVRD